MLKIEHRKYIYNYYITPKILFQVFEVFSSFLDLYEKLWYNFMDKK